MIILDERTSTERLNNPRNLANRFGSREPVAQSNETPQEPQHESPVDSDSDPSSSVSPEDSGLGDSLNIIQKNVNRGNGISHPIPDFIKVLAGSLSRTKLDTQSNIAKEFGISQAEVSHIKRGNPNAVSPKVESQIESKLLEVKDSAVDRLMKSLGCITDEKLESEKDVGKLSSVAANLSRVIDRSQSGTHAGVVQLNIYAPQIKEESRFKTLEVTTDSSS
jgi:predicted transcriptional regulator